ncbi:MAG: hypothetical protein ACRCS6_13450, partial [Turicibacter sp.]
MATKLELELEVKEKDEALKQMQEQMAQMQSMMEQLMKNPKPTITSNVEENQLRGDDLIPVMSLCEGELNLCTEGYGQGDVFSFSQRGEVTDIYYDALSRIVQKNKSFTTEGKFYILDGRA